MTIGKQKKTAAERSKAYRDRKRGDGTLRQRPPGTKVSKWDAAQFVALDGEGESIGELEKFDTGRDGKVYRAQEHIYTLLAASTGESVYNGGKRLNTQTCIDFLLDLSDTYRKAIFVIFAGSYDINHILMFGFEKEFLKEIAAGKTVSWKYNNVEYNLEYRARKSLTLRRGLSFRQDSKGNWKTKWKSRIILWDVFGFFQESFVGVIGKWLGKDHRHYELIKRMKKMRGNFANVAQKEINTYNAAELECLVELMVKVRDAIDGLGLVCNRWDGAGAVAAALMRKHKIKEFKCDTPPYILEAVQTAYAGGRIEVCKIGTQRDKIYDYDINSAYPHVMASLPCLAHGTWIEGEGDVPAGFTLVHCKYDFADGMPFYPLFYRTDGMQICFASKGEGIYWYPEYKAATECPGIIGVIKWWHFKPECDHKPFNWIVDYYKTRQQWVKNPLEEWQSGGEKIIKLGLNSLYGKSAQQLGGNNGRAPAYHQMEWAGYITSATRARLYSAAMGDCDAVIGFATDGIFTNRPLPIEHSREKTIGAWDVKEFDGLTLAMAGVYWWHDGETYKHFSRGFDKESMETPALVYEAWKAAEDTVNIPMHRLVGLGSACASETFWKMRGRFTDSERTLSLNGQSFKRGAVIVKKTKPHKNMVDTIPAFNIKYESGMQECSCPYPLEWLELEDFKNELELERESEDTENI